MHYNYEIKKLSCPFFLKKMRNFSYKQ